MSFKDTEEFFQKAGLWRLAKASLIEDEKFREGLRQRLPREIGRLFVQYVETAGEIDEDLDHAVYQLLKDSVLLRFKVIS